MLMVVGCVSLIRGRGSSRLGVGRMPAGGVECLPIPSSGADWVPSDWRGDFVAVKTVFQVGCANVEAGKALVQLFILSLFLFGLLSFPCG